MNGSNGGMMNRVRAGGRSAANGSNCIYIGRGTIYGNEFIIGKDGTREEVIAKYKAWFYSRPNIMYLARIELINKTLVCHCAPLPCHGDVIAEYLQQFEPEGLL